MRSALKSKQYSIFIVVATTTNASVKKVDAANNWWGDNSGPFYPFLNPGGKGDTVSDSVIFIPWITISKSNEQQNNVTGSNLLLWNQENGGITFQAIVEQPCIIRISLYDLQGRLVKTFEKKHFTLRKRISFLGW